MRRRGSKSHGTPTGAPEPQAIDPWSGFKIPLSELVRQWDNNLVWSRTVDKRNPQDFVRGIKDDQSLPYSRPESPDVFVAGPITWESGAFLTSQSGGVAIYEEGLIPADTL